MTATAASAVRTRRRRSGAATGTRLLLPVSLHHNGRLIAPWILIVSALSASSVLVYPWVFPDQEDREGLQQAVDANPAIGLIFGPPGDLLTADGFNAWRALALGGFLAAMGAVLTVTRATRGQEDSGQAELLASGVLGRSARLMTGVAMSLLGSLVLGVVAALLTILCGGGTEPSLLLAATFTVTGWMFAALAAVTAQIGADARTSNAIAVATLGSLFILRGFAYSVEAPSWTIWINPLGWMQETAPSGDNLWWPLALGIALTAVLLAVAFALENRRDFGQGLVEPRPGPARGKVRRPWGLAWRLSRGSALTWAIAFVLLGAVFGYFATSIVDLIDPTSPMAVALAGGAASAEALVAAFVVMILSMIGIFAAIPSVQVMLRVRSEEVEDRVEPVMATAVARPRYYAANVALAFALPVLYMAVAGTVVAALASSSDLGVDFGEVLAQALVMVPATWTIVAVSVFVVGARPHVAVAAWAGVAASLVLTLLGPSFGLADWVLGISPLWHVPDVLLPDPDWTGLMLVSLFTLAFTVIGFVGFRRRDLAV
ncbi:ABC transporter permease [Demequina activiva]|uniref:Exporter of polyketide antibiotics n=1 Tax=Demequina activiva TaxID=1582364 RepID=A0A919Q2W0_9MICO|nr:ABC transporter permease [Demequina activiva]GIG55245.1 exporter of polyketide antibiotics [Demequina activiva]